MAKQVQIRGAANAAQSIRTLLSRELDIDVTNERLNVHNGSRPGGVPHLNYKDAINQEFSFAEASGADAIALTLSLAPASLVRGMMVSFIAAAANTGPVTLNVNALGAVTAYKKDVFTGAVVNLEAGDLIAGSAYSAIYDGTAFQILSVDSGGIKDVGQADLRSSNGTVSFFSGGVTLPGGQYGFFPLMRSNSAKKACMVASTSGSYQAIIDYVDPSSTTLEISQRYVTSSPPFDLGDGEAGGFIFLKLNKKGDVVSHYAADVPPWGYNGPTDIRGQICPVTNKKYQRAPKKRSLAQVLDGAPQEFEMREVTQAIKNADMDLIPHPFEDTKNETIVMLDPMCPRVRALIDFQNEGGAGEIMDAVAAGHIRTECTALKRKGPKGVMITPLVT